MIWGCFRVICSWILVICSWFCGLWLECEAGFWGFPGFVICAFLKNRISVICGWFWNFWEDFGGLWLDFVLQGWLYEQVCWFVAAFFVICGKFSVLWLGFRSFWIDFGHFRCGWILDGLWLDFRWFVALFWRLMTLGTDLGALGTNFGALRVLFSDFWLYFGGLCLSFFGAL